MQSINDISRLLGDVDKLYRHSEEIKRLKGEKFNVFSILGLERNENRTHSAFIAELLNPIGSHAKGSVFLNHLLKLLDITNFDSSKATVRVEKHVGKVDRENKTGGRVDIEIRDGLGKTICIENKIHAGDQDSQIIRYCKYNTGRNTVLYLTLNGDEPGEHSKHQLESGKDFKCISYGEVILAWLQECLKDAADDPILRESIKQYMILIKKLTGQLTDRKMEKQLEEYLLKNPIAAELVYQNFPKLFNQIRDAFRDQVFLEIKAFLPDTFEIVKGRNVSTDNSQLWIKPVSNGETTFPAYGIETFSGTGFWTGQLIYGIYSDKPLNAGLPKSLEKLASRENWVQYAPIFDGHKDVNFADPEFVAKLALEDMYKERLISKIVDEFKAYFEETKTDFLSFFAGQ